MPESDHFLYFVMYMMAGSGLIVFSMRMFSQGLQVLLEEYVLKISNWMGLTASINFVSGILLSFGIQSSLSTCTMAMSYTGSGLLSLRQLYIILATSGIGTALTAFIFYRPQGVLGLYLILIAFLPMMYSRYSKTMALGRVLFSIGLMLVSFSLMSATVAPEWPKEFLEHVTFSPGIVSYMGLIAVGLVLMVILRSCVAIIALLMAFVFTGTLSAAAGAFIVLGMNLGKSIPLISASLPSRIAARRGVVAYSILLFLSLIACILCSPVFLQLSSSLSNLFFENWAVVTLPISHLLFNLVLIFFAGLFYWPMMKYLPRLFPDPEKKTPQKLIFLGRTSHMSPLLAIEQIHNEIKKMAATVENSLQHTMAVIQSEEEVASKKVNRYEDITDKIQDEIFNFMARVMEVPLTERQGERLRAMSRVVGELESIADRCKLISESIKEMKIMGVPIEGGFKQKLTKLFSQLTLTYEKMFEQMTVPVVVGENDYAKEAMQFDQMMISMRKDYLTWLRSEVGSNYQVEAGIKLSDILVAIKQIRANTTNVFESLAIL